MGENDRTGKEEVVSKVESLLSRMKDRGEDNTKIRKVMGREEKEKDVMQSYSGFIATPPTVNTSVTASMINQTLWNATAKAEEREKEKEEDKGSVLENRVEVEEVRQELLDRLSGSASTRARNMGLSEGSRRAEDHTAAHGNGTTVAASTTEASEEVNTATLPSRSDSESGVPSLAEAYGDLPRWLLGPMLTFFRTPGVAEGDSERELYEIASILCLRESLDENDVNFDDFQQRIVARFQRLTQMPGAGSSDSCNSSNSSSSSSSSSSSDDSSGAWLGGEGDVALLKDKAVLVAECRALMDSLEAMDAEDEQKAVMRARLVKFMVRLEAAIDASEPTPREEVPEDGRVGGVPFPGLSELVTDLEKAGLVEGESSPVTGEDAKETEVKKALQGILAPDDAADAVTTAERLVKTYFDLPSRQGVGISREGAGRFQKDVLSGLFVVNSVSTCDGATIYEGQPKVPDTFADDLYSRWEGSSMKEEVGYTIVLNEKVPNFDGGFEQAALDVLLGASPCVIVYPSSWNSTIEASNDQPFVQLWQAFLSSATVVSSGIFAGNCLNMFDLEGPFAKTGELPEDFLPLALAPVVIQLLASVSEGIVGLLKNVTVKTLTIPTLTLSTFGSRSVYTNMPRSRDEMFDIALVGVAVPLLSALALMVYGIQLTTQVGGAAAASFPTLPVSLLKVNAVVSNIFLPAFPGIIGNSGATADSVHLHWLAIVGAVSFIANSLQLLPLDNSAGSKLSYAVLGRENFDLLTVFTSLVKFLFIFPLLFGLGGDDNSVIAAAGILSVTKLLLDYVITSQLATDSNTQIALDNLSGVSEGRKIISAGLLSLLVYSYFPFDGVAHSLEWLTGGSGAKLGELF